MPVMNRAEILDYVECWSNGEWFEPPVSFAGLAKSFRASTHHSSALFFKANVLASTFRPHRWLSRHAFERWALDFLTFGNGYLERRRNMVGGTLRLEPALAIVCDLFAGSGTFLAAAREAGLHWIGCETNAAYHAIALHRLGMSSDSALQVT
ncbi:portal protein [Burkholderia pseudomallei]|nr:portal protein [Burkholderia pseudomallei]